MACQHGLMRVHWPFVRGKMLRVFLITLALAVSAAARIRAEAGLVDDPQTLVPDYLRPSYAEERRDGGP